MFTDFMGGLAVVSHACDPGRLQPAFFGLELEVLPMATMERSNLFKGQFSEQVIHYVLFLF